MKLVFMGTPAFAIPALEALIASPHEVLAVYSQPPRPAGRGMKLTPSPVQSLAEKHGIPVHTPANLKSPEAQEAFAAHDADVAVVAAYGLLLPQAILDAPKHGCINIHPSDLPRWRGAAPLARTIMAGDTATACCIMQMEAGLDTGPVLAREMFAIPPAMDTGGLHDAMAQLGARLLLAALDAIAAGRAHATPQAPDGVTYAQKITRADRVLDFTRPAGELASQVRGLSPSPAALIGLKGEPVKVFSARAEAGNALKPAGTVLDDALLINAGGGSALRLLELQRPGKNRQNSQQFLQGWPIPAGARAEPVTHNA